MVPCVCAPPVNIPSYHQSAAAGICQIWRTALWPTEHDKYSPNGTVLHVVSSIAAAVAGLVPEEHLTLPASRPAQRDAAVPDALGGL